MRLSLWVCMMERNSSNAVRSGACFSPLAQVKQPGMPQLFVVVARSTLAFMVRGLSEGGVQGLEEDMVDCD
jgi:hypothetical protein